MSSTANDTLENFAKFVDDKVSAGTKISPELALALWRDRLREVQAIREGLDSLDTGQVRPIAAFLQELDNELGFDGEY